MNGAGRPIRVEEKPSTSDAREPRLHDAQNQSRHDGGIHGIAAVRQDSGSRFSGVAVLCGN
jgi:hypothetical protein